MDDWISSIEPDFPCWKGYSRLLAELPGSGFPDAESLNRLLPAGLVSANDAPIQFVPSESLPDVDYERHIFRAGEVSTRKHNWHDLFNALVWCRFPQLKVTMNALHFDQLQREKPGRRGKLRDALTLLDESGVIVAGSDMSLLTALASRDWQSAFVAQRSGWAEAVQVFVCGHAILEKFLSPYKSITAHALLVYCSAPPALHDLDRMLAALVSDPGVFSSTADLSPLPLMGIPGWWPRGGQNQDFYDDADVFRTLSGRKNPSRVIFTGDI
ncbi:MAG: DUF3025 domain-containing protein [Xanthomonadales bacterium]|nr:DUF3025 domain-containing protein [Gammaproteobacteria bacterium]MBT8054619.1 DUF3025 domain-containing protein [Gammaproteobacteria bacterium]NND58121.1 DUF3025 domain-containing protein [Xanthomonadales bacterium]NNK50394.1 DUF3025 domain-containing protein [Xanthomonadales bacterium]